MDENKKSYYAIIPANVRYDKELTANAKLLYAEITALCNEKGYCWAINEYFADLYGVSTRSVKSWISQLVNKKYIFSEIIYKENSKEILYRYLKISNETVKQNPNTMVKKTSLGSEENFPTPREENFPDNNKYNNNKYYIKERKKETNYDAIISEFNFSKNVKTEIYEFIKMRKMKKKPLTDRALKIQLNKLLKLSNNEEEQIQIIDKSVVSCWDEFYELKENKKQSDNGWDYIDEQLSKNNLF